MNLSFLRILTLSFGIATGLSAAITCLVFYFTPNHREPITPFDNLLVILLWMILPLLSVVGSYLYVVKHETLGLKMLSASGIFHFFSFLLIGLSIMGSWYYPTWLALVNLSPSVLAMLTMSFALSAKEQTRLP
jgi:hypothetical protein